MVHSPKTSPRAPEAPPRPDCRTRAVSPHIGAFGECLAPGPQDCPYVLHFGRGPLCFHSRWQDFLEQK